MRALGGLVVLAVAVAAGAAPGPSFGPAREVAASAPDVGAGTELTMGDVNGDGIADAVIARITFPPAHITHPLGIFLGDGRGGYIDGSSLWDGPPARTEWARQILVADFNGDGRNDIFVADHGYDADPFPGHPNTLVLSTPQGKLVDASDTLPAESDFSHSAAAADIDGDGDLDIYVGNLPAGPGTGPPEILVNDGSGHFTRRTDLLPAQVLDYGTRAYTRSLFVDVNADGAPDLILGDDGRSPASRVLINDGTGRFSFGGALPAKPFGPNAIAISLATLDVNRDGHPDLLVAYTQGDPYYVGSFVQVLINRGDGTFDDETSTRLPDQPTTQGWPYFLRIADVNGDGLPDFGVVLNGDGSEHGLLYEDDGSGRYRQVQFRAATAFFAFADANGDGHPDIFSIQPNAPLAERHYVQLSLSPVVSTFGPHSGAAGTSVTVTGANLGRAADVRLGQTSVAFSAVSDGVLTFRVPAGASSGRISVTTPNGVAASSIAFTVVTLPPKIASFSPDAGVSGTSVVIAGEHLGGATSVTFGSVAAVFSVVGDTRILATVPVTAVNARIAVTTAGGTSTSRTAFTLVPPAPAIASVTPSAGRRGRARVLIRGSGFSGATAVTFDGVRASFAVVDDRTIRATVPFAAGNGHVAVVTPRGTAVSASTFTVS